MANKIILELLNSIRPEFDFLNSENFVEDGYLDSFDVVSLVSELEDKFDVIVDGLDVIPENFTSVESIIEMLKKNGASI